MYVSKHVYMYVRQYCTNGTFQNLCLAATSCPTGSTSTCLRRPHKCQKRPTIGAKETYCYGLLRACRQHVLLNAYWHTYIHVYRQTQSRRALFRKKRPSPLLRHTHERHSDSLLTSLGEESVMKAGFRLGLGWLSAFSFRLPCSPLWLRSRRLRRRRRSPEFIDNG